MLAYFLPLWLLTGCSMLIVDSRGEESTHVCLLTSSAIGPDADTRHEPLSPGWLHDLASPVLLQENYI